MNGKYVSPSKLEGELKLHTIVEQASVDGRGKENTYAIIQPAEDALRAGLASAGITVNGSFEELCNNDEVKKYILKTLKTEVMEQMGWKKYEMPRTVILDPKEWTVEDVLTPSMKVKRRILEKRFAAEIDAVA
jgi:long-chain acyl-CoA synthetase